MVLFG